MDSSKIAFYLAALTAICLVTFFSAPSLAKSGVNALRSLKAMKPLKSWRMLTRRQLIAKFDDERLMGPALKTSYSVEGKSPVLQIEAGNIAGINSFDVFIKDIQVATLVLQFDQFTGLAKAEVDFRDQNWPYGLPTTLYAGDMVKFIDDTGNVAAEGPLNPK